MPPLPWDPPLLTFIPSLCIPSLLDLLLLALKKRPESSALVGLQPPLRILWGSIPTPCSPSFLTTVAAVEPIPPLILQDLFSPHPS